MIKLGNSNKNNALSFVDDFNVSNSKESTNNTDHHLDIIAKEDDFWIQRGKEKLCISRIKNQTS